MVEDEPAILRVTTKLLQAKGYAVLGASSPEEAVRLARAHTGQVHLLLTDVVMPEMNGRDLAKQLMSDCANMKCLFMSGYTSDVIAKHGVLEEGVDFIQKPFSVTALVSAVRRVLDAGVA